MTEAIPSQKLILEWSNNPRWENVVRPYAATDVMKLRGTVEIEYSLARMRFSSYNIRSHNIKFAAYGPTFLANLLAPTPHFSKKILHFSK